jgi:hypothetical protein
MYTKEANKYSIGKMVQHIWKEKCNKERLCNVVGMNISIAKLKALIYEDPKNRASLSSTIEAFTSSSVNFELLDCCLCYGIVEFV